MIRKLLAGPAVAALVLGASLGANAAVISVDVVSANWTNVVGDINTALTFVNSDGKVGFEEVRWGGSSTALSDKSGYRFDGYAPPAISVATDTAFGLGLFTHFNNPIPLGTSITSAQLNIAVDLQIDGVALSEGPFTFSFLHNETLNAGWNCPSDGTPCNDLVTVSNLTTSDTFDVGGTEYTLSILGFLQGGVITNSFSTVEGQTNTAEVRAMFTATNVSEPATMALLGLGLIGLGAIRRNRARKA